MSKQVYILKGNYEIFIVTVLSDTALINFDDGLKYMSLENLNIAIKEDLIEYIGEL